jgi:MFS family permease
VRRRRALAALCLTEIVSYGVLYYAFPVLAGDISAAAGWSRIAVTAAFSAASLAAALSGVAVGRLIDRYGPRPVMTAGSVLAAIAVAAIAGAPAYGWFLAAWLLAGVAMAGVFYPPAFAALTAWYGADRVRALTTLTLAAGFASTIFAPLTSALSGHLGWRGTYLVLAAILAAVTIPAHALALRLPWAGRPGRRLRPAGGAGLREVLASRTFLLLAGAMTLLAFGLYAVVVNLVPLLTGRGLAPATAAWALGLGGLGQVAGRLCYQALCARAGVTGRLLAVTAAGVLATVLLAVLPGPAVALIAAAVLAGAVRGLFTLLQATAVSDRWGADGYASLNGVFVAPQTAAIALAPTIGAAIASALGGYPGLFGVLAVCCAASAALAVAARPRPAASPPAPGLSPPGQGSVPPEPEPVPPGPEPVPDSPVPDSPAR